MVGKSGEGRFLRLLCRPHLRTQLIKLLFRPFHPGVPTCLAVLGCRIEHEVGAGLWLCRGVGRADLSLYMWGHRCARAQATEGRVEQRDNKDRTDNEGSQSPSATTLHVKLCDRGQAGLLADWG